MSLAANHIQQSQTEEQDAEFASWRERALNAEAALSAAQGEIRQQRNHIADLLGRIRDSEDGSGTLAQVADQNATLKQQIRELGQDNRALEERLKAARSNNRSADRRLAELEAQLLDRPPATIRSFPGGWSES